MKKLPRPSVLLDRLHKAAVLACIGVTMYGLGHLGMRWYRYFTVLRPESKQKELLDKQALLREGSSEILTDKAAPLTG